MARGLPDDSRNPNFNEPCTVKARATADTVDAYGRAVQAGADVIQVTNEPVLDKNPDIQREALKQQAEYDAECARWAAERGIRTSFGNWSWGTPEVEAMDAYREGFEAAVELGCPVLLYEYDLPDVDWAWSLYRHRLWWKRLPSHLHRNLRLIIGESEPHWREPPHGWLGKLSPEEYSAWAVTCDHEIHQDEYVLGATLFAKAAYDTLWWSFDTTPLERDLIRLATPAYRPLPGPGGGIVKPPTLLGRDFPGEDLRGTLPVCTSRHYSARSLEEVDKTILHHSAVRPAATDVDSIRPTSRRSQPGTCGGAGRGSGIMRLWGPRGMPTW